MNLSPRWVEALSEYGFDVAHWSAIGALDAPDVQIMDHARQTGSVILTHDLDFGAILAATQGAKPSVVQIRGDDVSPEAIGTRVAAALAQMEAELEEGVLVTIDPGRTRLRILPLRLR